MDSELPNSLSHIHSVFETKVLDKLDQYDKKIISYFH